MLIGFLHNLIADICNRASACYRSHLCCIKKTAWIAVFFLMRVCMQPKHINCLTLWFYPKSDAPDFLPSFNQRDDYALTWHAVPDEMLLLRQKQGAPVLGGTHADIFFEFLVEIVYIVVSYTFGYLVDF